MTVRRTIVSRIRKAQASARTPTLWDQFLLGSYNRYRRFKRWFESADNESLSKLYLRSRNLKRNLEGKGMSFVNVDQATIWTLEWIQTFPRRYDLVVGIPRSGMFIASLIAVKLGKALTTPDLLRSGKYWHSKNVGEQPALDGSSHVLLVDDAMDSGTSMSRAIDTIREGNKDINITRACLVVREEAKSSVDMYHKIISPPRAYEWNILHRKIASHWGPGRLAVDLDGVLCPNCPPGTDDNERAYLDWLAAAKPYLIPSFEIDAIVTCRLERYRPQTEQWLREHGVRYKELHMWDVPSKNDRRGRFARHKIERLLNIKPDMFWESNWDQSQSIWKKTSIPTLCIDRMILLS